MYHRLERELVRDRMRSRSCAREKSSKSRSMFCMMWMDEKLFLSSRSPAKVNKSSWNRFSLQSSTIFRMCQRLFFCRSYFVVILLSLNVIKEWVFRHQRRSQRRKTGCNTIDCQKKTHRSSKKRAENVDHNYVKGVARLDRFLGVFMNSQSLQFRTSRKVFEPFFLLADRDLRKTITTDC